jgi:hypothetical protein
LEAVMVGQAVPPATSEWCVAAGETACPTNAAAHFTPLTFPIALPGFQDEFLQTADHWGLWPAA